MELRRAEPKFPELSLSGLQSDENHHVCHLQICFDFQKSALSYWRTGAAMNFPKTGFQRGLNAGCPRRCAVAWPARARIASETVSKLCQSGWYSIQDVQAESPRHAEGSSMNYSIRSGGYERGRIASGLTTKAGTETHRSLAKIRQGDPLAWWQRAGGVEFARRAEHSHVWDGVRIANS